MSVNAANLTGGQAYVAFNSKNIEFEGDLSLSVTPTTAVMSSALRGDFDEMPTDLIVKVTGTPRYYDTAALTIMYPYIGGVGPGTFYGTGNAVANCNSINGDQFNINNALIGKMPDLILGIDKTIMGPMEFWGVIQSGDDPTNTAAYYTFNASGGSYSYSQPTLPGTALSGQQEYTVTFGSVTGMTSFQAQETWNITHQYTLVPVMVQKRTRCFRLGKGGYRCIARGKPADATMTAILAAFGMQGANATMGTKLSQLAKAANGGASVPSLTFAGTSNVTAVLANAALKTAGFQFGAESLRQGEIAFVTTQPGAGALAAPLTLS